jgi:hypothetical protein
VLRETPFRFYAPGAIESSVIALARRQLWPPRHPGDEVLHGVGDAERHPVSASDPGRWSHRPTAVRGAKGRRGPCPPSPPLESSARSTLRPSSAPSRPRERPPASQRERGTASS